MAGSTTARADGHISVLSTIPAIHSLVMNLEPGTDVLPVLLLEDGDTVHDIKATPGKLELLLNSDIVLLVGIDDPSLISFDRLVELRGSRLGLVDLRSQFSREELVWLENCHSHAHGDDGHDAHDDHGHEEVEDKHDSHGHEKEEDGHDSHDDHGHDQDDHGHDDDEGSHDDHDMAAGGEGCLDPHIWLSTKNSKKMIGIIAEALRKVLHEKEHLENLSGNVALAESMLEATSSQVYTILEQHRPDKDTAIVVMHDAFQYFGRDHFLPEYEDAGQADVHSPTPSGKKLTEIIDHLSEAKKGCVVVQSDQEKKAYAGLFEGLGNVKLVVADPVYMQAGISRDSYNRMMTGIASAFAECYS